MLRRITIFTYGAFAYALFFLTFLYAAGFVGDIAVIKSIDGTPTSPLWQALLIDTVLLGVFAVQHSIMARPTFKRWLTRYIPAEAERSTFVLASSLALIALFAYWEPIGGTIWRVSHPVGQAVLYGLFAFGWGLVLVSTVLINHFDLFGLRQSWLALRGRPYTPLTFKTPGIYKYVRHPLYVGFLCGFWATPTMTVTHLFFALATTAYILIAIQLEEHDLVKFHPEYSGYRKRVPMLIPFFGGKRGINDAAEVAAQTTN